MQKEDLAALLLKEIGNAKKDFATKRVSDLECTTSAEFLNSIKNYYNYYSPNNDDSYLEYIKERLENYKASQKTSVSMDSSVKTYYLLTMVSRPPAVLFTIFGLVTGNLPLIGAGAVCAGIMLYSLQKLKKAAQEQPKQQKDNTIATLDMNLLKAALLENKERILPELKY